MGVLGIVPASDISQVYKENSRRKKEVRQQRDPAVGWLRQASAKGLKYSNAGREGKRMVTCCLGSENACAPCVGRVRPGPSNVQ